MLNEMGKHGGTDYWTSIVAVEATNKQKNLNKTQSNNLKAYNMTYNTEQRGGAAEEGCWQTTATLTAEFQPCVHTGREAEWLQSLAFCGPSSGINLLLTLRKE